MQKEVNQAKSSNDTPKINLARDNHFIPQMYQVGWSEDGKNICEYKMLVHDVRYPIWAHRSIKNTGVWKNLYTRVSDGAELDDYEHMFNERFESPAIEPLKIARAGGRLTRDDWNTMLRFVCAQHVRTPAFFFASREVEAKYVSEAFSEAVEEVQDFNLSAEPSADYPESEISGIKFNELVPISMTLFDYDDNHTGVNFEATIGKGNWLNTIQHHLDDQSILMQALCSLKWSIADAPEGTFWPTSDKPLALGALRPDGEIECVFGIAQANIILFPISSKKLLITCPGAKIPSRFIASSGQARIFRKLIVKNAFLYVYSAFEDDNIPVLRPRVINKAEAVRIASEFGDWYDVYNEQEAPMLGRDPQIIDLRVQKG